MTPRGVGLYVAPDVWVRTDGAVFVRRSTRGLADSISETDWTEWGKLGTGILDKILQYKLQSKQVSYGQYPIGGGGLPVAGGSNYGVSGPGLFGTINPMYLLLGAGVLAFVMMRK